MKTIRLFYVLALAGGISLASCSNSTSNQTKETEVTESTKINGVTVNPADSKVVWKGEMLGIYSHSGTLKMMDSNIDVKDGQITGGSFTVDMGSMTPTDENYNPEEGSTPEKLVGHLSSPDFFDVENHPTAKFEITSVNGTTATGNLTLRGITNEEKVDNIKIMEDNGQVIISGDLVFERKKYDVSWDSPVKDRVLSNDIEVKVELVGKQG